MLYYDDMDWMDNAKEFPDPQRKVMLALSYKKQPWRNRDVLLKVTRLEQDALDRALSHLLIDDYIRPALSDRGNIVFALRERVG